MGHYFYDDVDLKIIKVSLLTTQAKDWANAFIYPNDVNKLARVGMRIRESKPGARSFPDNRLNSTQLRKFHLEVKEYEYQLMSANDRDLEFRKIKPLIKMLTSKVAYASSLKTSKEQQGKVPKTFKKFIDDMIQHIETCDDFFAFSKCFEAVVGFFYGEGGGH